jgi:hypothetical protein
MRFLFLFLWFPRKKDIKIRLCDYKEYYNDKKENKEKNVDPVHSLFFTVVRRF